MPTIFKEFEVEGTGRFPLDMLRYDECWPKREAQIRELELSIKQVGPITTRRITLRGLRSPTVKRWESFGWKVIEERKVR